ncbi:ATP-dependent Clp protease proteolytic subunit [Pseudobythopirellula maris]|uniref:ATP-dependent Clp protease proteolytic subunit n=1 Tax=Pseudobythopirellula maris TaxID=2527991 RepID=A0A5C5ZMJ7_9BACT|nr:ATP-dependent Clp protease proteolytic subunit [Pseudobythopirellula maris]TWT88639.1 ATP-dependent Clp protease proteolytic subunit [Pseudobythopirellula maris]
MKPFTQLVLTFVLFIVGMAATACLAMFALVALLVYQAAEYAGGVENLGDTAIHSLVDIVTESGFDRSELDPDEPLLLARTILVTEAMNERVARHVTERLLFLNQQDPKAPIELRLSTSGGWLDAAFAIVDTMRAIDAPVNVTAIGGCYSAGSVVLAAGTGERRATPNAVVSVHVNPYDMRDPLDAQEYARFERVYREHAELPEEWFNTSADRQYYLDAEQSLRAGLIDEITEPKWEPRHEAPPAKKKMRVADTTATPQVATTGGRPLKANSQ